MKEAGSVSLKYVHLNETIGYAVASKQLIGDHDGWFGISVKTSCDSWCFYSDINGTWIVFHVYWQIVTFGGT